MSIDPPPLTPVNRVVTITEDDAALDIDALLIDDSISPSRQEPLESSRCTSFSPRPDVFISASEDNAAVGESHWTLPAPSQPGDFLTTSIHKVPSKSILKKTSSYGNFDLNESISSSRRGSSSLTKNTFSLLSFDTSVKSGIGSATQSRNRSDSYGLGLDLDSSSQSQMNSSFIGVSQVRNPQVSPFSPVVDDKPELPNQSDNADAAGGSDASASSKLSTSGNMKRSVSFSAVNVREYDRTIGDNVSFRIDFNSFALPAFMNQSAYSIPALVQVWTSTFS